MVLIIIAGVFVCLWAFLIVDLILNEEEWLGDMEELDRFWEENF